MALKFLICKSGICYTGLPDFLDLQEGVNLVNLVNPEILSKHETRFHDFQNLPDSSAYQASLRAARHLAQAGTGNGAPPTHLAALRVGPTRATHPS